MTRPFDPAGPAHVARARNAAPAGVGGDNALMFGQGGAFGMLTGDVAVGGTLTVDPGTAAGAAATLNDTVKDYVDPAAGTTTPGSLNEIGPGTLARAGANTHSGGTLLASGTLDLYGPTVLDGTAIASGAPGTGSIAFGSSAPATLQIEGAALSFASIDSDTLTPSVSGSRAGDAVACARWRTGCSSRTCSPAGRTRSPGPASSRRATSTRIPTIRSCAG